MNDLVFRPSWVLRKEHTKGYWTHAAATGLKMDYVSRPKAIESLAKLGFPEVAGGWNAHLLKPETRTLLAQIISD